MEDATAVYCNNFAFSAELNTQLLAKVAGLPLLRAVVTLEPVSSDAIPNAARHTTPSPPLPPLLLRPSRSPALSGTLGRSLCCPRRGPCMCTAGRPSVPARQMRGGDAHC